MPEISFEGVRKAVWGEEGANISYTIEFYPEEGKYHYTGHRNCKVVYSPNDARKLGTVCPVCGKNLTVGVMSRVEALSSQEITNDKLQITNDKLGVAWIRDEKGKYPPYVMLVPLLEILSEALIAGVGSQTVINVYEQLIHSFESEFNVLLKTEIADIAKMAGQKISEAIQKVRSGDIFIKPGYDGVFGTVKIWKEEEEKEMGNNQASLF